MIHYLIKLQFNVNFNPILWHIQQKVETVIFIYFLVFYCQEKSQKTIPFFPFALFLSFLTFISPPIFLSCNENKINCFVLFFKKSYAAVRRDNNELKYLLVNSLHHLPHYQDIFFVMANVTTFQSWIYFLFLIINKVISHKEFIWAKVWSNMVFLPSEHLADELQNILGKHESPSQ